MMQIRRFVSLVLLLVCEPVFAIVNTNDVVPAATLLLPYFEVDISNSDGVNTLFSINNASATAVLAHVTLWTDQSVPALNFDLYLTGYDVQTIDLREILVNGNVPVTASAGQDPQDTVSPQGSVSQDINFASCSSLPYSSPSISAPFRAHLQAWLQGNQSPATGNCAGSRRQDNILRGYITVDTVNACNLFFPSDWAFYAPFLTHQNVLWGDYFYVNSAQNTAVGEAMIHIESYPICFIQADHTFYGLYNGASGADGREPLPAMWAARFANDGSFGGATDLLVWREAGNSAAAYSCNLSGPPSWYPLSREQIVIFDEEEQPASFEICPLGDPTCAEDGGEIPNAAGRIDVAADLLAPFDNGWAFLDLGHDGVTPIYGDREAQSWVAVGVDGGWFSTGYNAVQLARIGTIDQVSWPAPTCPGNCWQITGWLDAWNQPSNGVVGDRARLVRTDCVAPAPSGYGWLQPFPDTAGLAAHDLYVSVSLSDSHVHGSQYFYPILRYTGASCGKPVVIVDLILCTSCTNQMYFVTRPGPCL